MKRYSFFLALAILVVSFGLANADGITVVDHPVGTWVDLDDGGAIKLVPNTAVTYTLYYDNTNGPDVGGMTNGYVFSTDDPGGFGALSTTSLPNTAFWEAFFNLVWAEGPLDATTVRFGGSKGGGSVGMPAGFAAEAFTITVADGIDAGYELCLDSTYYPPTGTWKWVGVTEVVWGGGVDGYCYTAKVPPCLAPIVDNLPGAPLAEYHCDAFNYQFTMVPDGNDGSGAVYPDDLEWVGASHGTVDAFGNWTYAAAVTEEGSFPVTITVGNGQCTADYDFTITVMNHEPVLDCPATLAMTTGSKEFDFTATDGDDCADLTYSVISHNMNDAYFTDDVLMLIEDDETGSPYEVVVQVSDGQDASDPCTIAVEVIAGSDYQIAIDCFGGPAGPVYQGQYVDVDVTLNAAVGEIGGYDLLIAYDNSGLSFQYAEMGPEYMLGEEGGWEYFNYRTDMCSGACPSGILRVVAIAETNNGAAHPLYFGLPAPNVMFSLRFLVTNDRTFECRSLPLRFFWYDCADNTLSNRAGDVLFMSDAVFDGYDPDASNGYIDIYRGDVLVEDAFPTFFGAPWDCAYDDKGLAINAVSFENGCVFIACADEIDARGDINMNDMPNEIADAVLYSRYFVYGMSVFNSTYIEGQIAASDVNNDGIALSVADLVYLVRIITGDALPYPKLAPMATTIVNSDGVLSVEDAMGGAVVSVEGNVTPELLVDNMEMMYNFDEASNATRILVYSMNLGTTFEGSFLNANGNVASVELATYEGATVTAKILPGDYQLSQNYPNPFNPTTKVAFAVPTASEVTLTIYNITGQKVAEFAGAYEAGNHIIEWDASNQASGIYFYKMNADNFEMTKKMVLLK